MKTLLVNGAVCLAGYCLYKWWYGEYRFTREVLLFDAAFGGYLKEDSLEKAESGSVFSRAAYEAAMEFKDQYGEMKYNNANKLIAGEFVREYFRKNYPDMRNADRVKHCQYAIEWCLLPTEAAVTAAEFAKCRTVVTRRGAAYLAR